MSEQSTREALSPSWESPKYADVTLRAGEDGAEMRVHATYLMELSGVFAGLLSGDVALKDNVIPLPGKTVTELKLLCSFLCPTHSRFELVTLDNADAFCKMAQEYDMPLVLAAVEECFVLHAEQLLDVNVGTYVHAVGERKFSSSGYYTIRRATVSKRFRLLNLADTYKMTRLNERIVNLLKAAPWAVRDMGRFFPDELKSQTSTMHSRTVGELWGIMTNYTDLLERCASLSD